MSRRAGIRLETLKRKNAPITGGTSGIGLAVARRFLAAGATVAVSDITDGTRVAEEIGAVFMPINVADEQSVATALAQAEAALGKLDIVVNNADVGDIGANIEDTSSAMLERITSINQHGVFYGLKHAPRHMSNYGSIINTPSMAAYVCMPGTGAYTATKGLCSI